MPPNHQYLCIVAARDSRAEKLFLPFDDDPVLSLILSKAFLLANDTAIEDKTITAQIKRGLSYGQGMNSRVIFVSMMAQPPGPFGAL